MTFVKTNNNLNLDAWLLKLLTWNKYVQLVTTGILQNFIDIENKIVSDQIFVVLINHHSSLTYFTPYKNREESFERKSIF